MADILNGKEWAQELLAQIAWRVGHHQKAGFRPPGLCTILVGNEPASTLYVKNKQKKATSLGMSSHNHTLPESIPQEVLLQLIKQVNKDNKVDGILVQLPLPPHISTLEVLSVIDPAKDVDGLTPFNKGLLSMGKPLFIPCTPGGCMTLLQKGGISIAGAHAVIVGRSNLVGKPMAQLLLNANATITLCHTHTLHLPSYTQQADILIVAAGQAGLITSEHVREGSVVIDVGINRLPDGSIVGDVDQKAVMPYVKAITPVPGGVGPMTIAMLLQNTLLAYEKRIPHL